MGFIKGSGYLGLNSFPFPVTMFMDYLKAWTQKSMWDMTIYLSNLWKLVLFTRSITDLMNRSTFQCLFLDNLKFGELSPLYKRANYLRKKERNLCACVYSNYYIVKNPRTIDVRSNDNILWKYIFHNLVGLQIRIQIQIIYCIAFRPKAPTSVHSTKAHKQIQSIKIQQSTTKINMAAIHIGKRHDICIYLIDALFCSSSS